VFCAIHAKFLSLNFNYSKLKNGGAVGGLGEEELPKPGVACQEAATASAALRPNRNFPEEPLKAAIRKADLPACLPGLTS
jgi:hypothetical protein